MATKIASKDMKGMIKGQSTQQDDDDQVEEKKVEKKQQHKVHQPAGI